MVAHQPHSDVCITQERRGGEAGREDSFVTEICSILYCSEFSFFNTMGQIHCNTRPRKEYISKNALSSLDINKV